MAAKGSGEWTLRIVLLGKTGAGKSSLGNSLLGKTPPKSAEDQPRGKKCPAGNHKTPTEGFKVGRGMTSETLYCAWDVATLAEGTVLEVTDTPGLCDTHLDEEIIFKEVAKSVAVAEPGPNVIILVLRCDRRFTEEEYKAYLNIKHLFPEDMNKYLILVFNGLDCFEEEETIEEQREVLDQEVKKFGSPMTEMISEAGGRYFGMNNKAQKAEKRRQVQDLVTMMKDLVKKNGRDAHFSSKMTEEIQENVEELVKKEAKSTGLTQSQATVNVKKKIIEEEVEPGFLESVAGSVGSVVSGIAGGVSDMCSVM